MLLSMEPTLRDAIENAVEEHEPEGSELREVPAKAADVKPEGSAGEPAKADSPAGDEPKPASNAKPDQPAPTVSAKPGDDGAAPAAKPEGAAPAPSELKAPSQWKPQVKEKWAGLPREVQEEVLRREADTMRLVGSVGQKLRFSDEVTRALEPVAEKLQMNNVQPQEFVKDVFSTVTNLATGDQRMKAETVANIIQSYGIDVRVLDQVLTGRLSAPPPDPRVAEAQRRADFYERQARQNQETQVQQVASSAQQSLTEFGADPKNEFFEDVREFMADLLESGRVQTLADAYSAAVYANPDTRQILLQREAQARAANRGHSAQRARRASSAVHGAPKGPGAVSNPNATGTLRESIEAAFDEHSSP